MKGLMLRTCRAVLRLPVVTRGCVRLCSGAGGGRVGPDRVLPANSLTTTWPDGAVMIRDQHPHESATYPPKSVWTMLQVRPGPNIMSRTTELDFTNNQYSQFRTPSPEFQKGQH